MKYLFDLDGTVTAAETLPIISEHFNCAEQISVKQNIYRKIGIHRFATVD